MYVKVTAIMGAINVPKDVKVEFIEPAKPCLSFAIFDKYTVIAGRYNIKAYKNNTTN
ncbi:hypothetical protein ACVPOY_13065 [Staphylococcus aureus]